MNSSANDPRPAGPALSRRNFLLTGTLALPALLPRGARAAGTDNDPNAIPPGAPLAEALGLDGYGIKGRSGLKNVTLEMSPKPFREMTEGYIRKVSRVIFRQWAPLTEYADQISIMLWTADGSEILDYDGRMETAFEWAHNIGESNPGHALHVENDPEKKSLHNHGVLYMKNPPKLTYGRLAMLIRVLREVGREMTGKRIRIGATFDPGGEFALSDFKYKRHNEVCLGTSRGKGSFVCCYGILNGDSRYYAGFPHGIPQGTPFGTFFGRQCEHFLADLGYDYIWFSNGFGFGLETWMAVGPSFDGKRFYPERVPGLQEKLLDFWRDFRRECPGFLVETRGTNLLTGADLASNGTPLKQIYEGGFNMVTPPNSPWGALNNDFGLELAGYMSRIPELPPGKGFPFRFYTHDPWWLDSPWLDSYVHEPYDIFLPMSVSRVTGDGSVENANAIEFLTIDNSLGQMPNTVPLEVIPFLLDGLENRADRPGPVVWVYPFDEYFAMAGGAEGRLEEPFFGDWFIRAALNNGLPMNTVVSTKNFLSSIGRKPDLYSESILVTRVPDGGTEVSAMLLDFAGRGGRVLLYGPIGHAGNELLAALNLRRTEPISGEFDLELAAVPDRLTERPYPTRLLHRATMCAGGMEAELADPGDGRTRVIATAVQSGIRRVAALERGQGKAGGKIAWVLGTNSNSYRGGHLLQPDDPREYFAGDLLLRFALPGLGWEVAVDKRSPDQRNPVLAIARHRNGFFFYSFTPDLTVGLRLRMPQGAPLLIGTETTLDHGAACYHPPRALHMECRVFLEQEKGAPSCREIRHSEIGLSRRLLVGGLDRGVVRFYHDPGTEKDVTFLVDPKPEYFAGDFRKAEMKNDGFGQYLQIGPLSGSLLISW